ncbi:hypothetical protein DITRI_Ditri13aG0015900 [Diplodiscus trichospermus]
MLFPTRRLNPHAREWSPRAPLERAYGDCLEKIYVYKPPASDAPWKPSFGMVVFKGCLIPMVIIECGKKQAKFKVDGKDLWCKKFEWNKTNAGNK